MQNTICKKQSYLQNNNNEHDCEKILNLIAHRVYKAHNNSIDLEDKQLNDIFTSNVNLYIKFFALMGKNEQQEESYSDILNQINTNK